MNALKLPYASLPAQSLSCLHWLAANRPNLVKDDIVSFVEEEESHINFTDPRARATLAWICGEFAEKNEPCRYCFNLIHT